MIKKSLIVLLLVDFVLVLAFVLNYGKNQSFTLFYIGLLPLVLCNFIYAREFIANAEKPPLDKPVKKVKALPLLIMPLFFCLNLPALIKFNRSLGWSPIVSLGFGMLLCIVIIAMYGGLKVAFRGGKS